MTLDSDLVMDLLQGNSTQALSINNNKQQNKTKIKSPAFKEFNLQRLSEYEVFHRGGDYRTKELFALPLHIMPGRLLEECDVRSKFQVSL